ncbi:hypothetical protein Tsubulata_023328 [Turnera subulata]|uniref:Uncharacterized protein n=1 Tax=Turnera subulata TaxID=218843 RepID=A0A9Q0FLL4_9ROSI|nr:hypothetical protein Tsubulata_023328 [Turnera subulata]
MKRKSKQSVCFSIIGQTNTYWYTFDLYNEGEDDRMIVPCRCNCGCPCAKRIRRATRSLSPVKVLPKEARDHPGWTVVGNQLYRLGGTFRDGWVVSKTVRALDLTTNNGSSSNGGNNTLGVGWQRKARMLVARIAPATVVVGGKIYVLGGYMFEDNPDDTPWAEVYDPTSNIWEALPPPPKIPMLEFGCVFRYQFFSAGLEDDNDGEKGSIIVLSLPEELLLQYSVANKSWNMSKLDMCELQTWSGEPLGDRPYYQDDRASIWRCSSIACSN